MGSHVAQKYNVIRRRPLFSSKQERTLAIDGDTIRSMPSDSSSLDSSHKVVRRGRGIGRKTSVGFAAPKARRVDECGTGIVWTIAVVCTRPRSM